MSVEEPHRREFRERYVTWLDELDDELVTTALGVAEMMPRVARALQSHDDLVVSESRALASEAARRCRDIEQQGFLLLAREAPVAGDLRRLVSILRLVMAAERPAALLKHAAQTIEDADLRELPADVAERVFELAERSADVFRSGIAAWRSRDGLAVHDVDAADEAVDELARGLVVRAGKLDGQAEVIMLGLLARYYERIADHGVAFAQDAAFAVTGERVDISP